MPLGEPCGTWWLFACAKKSWFWMISVHPVQCAWSPVVEQVWGWGAGGAESLGVTHVLGLYSARWCQPGKGKAWFSPGRISQDVVSCINGGAGTGPVGRSDGGRSSARNGIKTHPAIMVQHTFCSALPKKNTIKERQTNKKGEQEENTDFT